MQTVDCWIKSRIRFTGWYLHFKFQFPQVLTVNINIIHTGLPRLPEMSGIRQKSGIGVPVWKKSGLLFEENCPGINSSKLSRT